MNDNVDRHAPPGEQPVRIVVCGPAGAGKTTLIDRLVRECGGGDAGRDDTGVRWFRCQGLLFSMTEAVALPTLAAASLSSDIAVVVVDATAASLISRRDLHMTSLLGIPRVVLAVSKLDLVDDSLAVVQRIGKDCHALAERLGWTDVPCVPVSESLLRCLIETARSKPRSSIPSLESTADRFEATIVWTAEQPMLRGRTYSMHIGDRTVSATVAPLKYAVDVETLERLPATTLGFGEVGVCQLELQEAVAFIPFEQNRSRQPFALIDLEGRTVGTGVLRFALRRSQNVKWQRLDIDQTARAEIKGQRPCVIWFTGLSGAGKSTIANLVEKRLHALGRHTYLLDGDNVRHGLSKDLGFTDADRVENIRRVAEVARLMVDAGLIVLVSFISPFRAERRMARELVAEGEFIEVFVDVPFEVAEARDPKGLYKKARSGMLKNFTGVDSPYETPEGAELTLNTTRLTPEESAREVLKRLALDDASQS